MKQSEKEEVVKEILKKETEQQTKRYNEKLVEINNNLSNIIGKKEADKIIKIYDSVYSANAIRYGVSREEIINKIKLDFKEVNNTNNIENDINIFYQTNPEIKENIEDVINTYKTNEDKRIIIGDVNNDLVNILKENNIDVEGYKHDIDTRKIRHIMKGHGDKGTKINKNSIPITDEDIRKIPCIINNFDYIELRENKGIRYIKTDNNGITYYVEEIRNKNKTLSAKTMWKNRSSQDNLLKLQTFASDKSQGTATPRVIIPNPNKKVNSENIAPHRQPAAATSPQGGEGLGNDTYYQTQPYTQDTININGEEKTVYNSNGDRIANTEEELRNFYKWFNNSKVVDKKGRPLVVYHGSPETNLEFFEHGHINYNIQKTEDSRKGFYFTNNKKVANTYATSIYKRLKDPKAKDGRIYDVYLKIENPLIIDYQNELYNETKNYKILNKAKKEKYDGVIFNKIRDAIDVEEKIPTSKSYAIFNSNQIKSINNQGTFNTKDNNIYYQSINNKLNLDQPVEILSIKNLLKDNKNTTKEKAKKIIQQIAESGEQIETLSEPWVMDIINNRYKKKHLLNSSKPHLGKTDYERRNVELNNLKDIINNSVLIERVDNIKTDKNLI